MDRKLAYQALVEKRKNHPFPDGLLNPSQIRNGEFDSDHIGPWSRWQGDLNAEVLVVGQDWGDRDYFERFKGRDNDSEPTCTNLKALAANAGWELGLPTSPTPQKIFLTNSVLGIRKDKGKSGAPPPQWIEDSLPFLVELLGIIQPRIVVSLGSAAYGACYSAMLRGTRDPDLSRHTPLNQLLLKNPIQRRSCPVWFALYHCSPTSIGRNRSLALQQEDWIRMGQYIRDHR